MSRQLEYRFKPQGPVADAYIACEAQRAFIMGPLGSAKTTASCWKAFRVMIQQQPNREGIRRSRILAVRNTFSDLMGTTAKDWLDLFRPLGRMVNGSKEPPTHFLDFLLSDGTRVQAEMVFLALDRPDAVRKLRGYQLTAAMLSEAKELPHEIVDMLDLRVGRYPAATEGGPTWYGIFGDTNAPDTDHWYYRLAEETSHRGPDGRMHKGPEGWRFFIQPGGLIRDTPDAPWRLNLQAENLRNLPIPKGGQYGDYYVKGMQGKADDWIAVNLANQYGYVRDGKPVYPDYNDQKHCSEFELVKALGLHIGLDFGLTPAALIGQRTVSGRWLIRDEVVMTDTGILRFADELNRFMSQRYAGWPVLSIAGDPAGGQRQAGDVDERTAFQLLASKNISAVPAPGNNDIVQRIEVFSAPMRKMIDGQPAFQIHPECKVTRKGLQGGYAYHRVKVANEERYRDMPSKNKYSHPCDAGQYMMLGANEGALVLESTTSDNARGYDEFRKAMGYR